MRTIGIFIYSDYSNRNKVRALFGMIKAKLDAIRRIVSKDETMKGQAGIGLLQTIVVGLAVVGLVAAFALQILGSVQATMTAASAEANATGDVITGISNMTGQFGNIGLIGAAVVVIGLLVGGLAVVGSRGRF